MSTVVFMNRLVQNNNGFLKEPNNGQPRKKTPKKLAPITTIIKKRLPFLNGILDVDCKRLVWITLFFS